MAAILSRPQCVKSGVFEQDWNNARVTPIYKDDNDINNENNYRPLPVINQIAKMIECPVSYQIIDSFGWAQFYFNGSICLFEKTLHPN